MKTNKRLGSTSASLKSREEKPAKAQCATQQVLQEVIEQRSPIAPPHDRVVRGESGAAGLPISMQEELFAPLLQEILTSETYDRDFGEKGAPREEVVSVLREAMAWALEAQNAWDWSSYADRRRIETWSAAKERLEYLRVLRDALSRRDPTMPGRYPTLRAFFGLRAEVGQRAAKTRATRRQAKENPVDPSKPEEKK